MTVDDIPGMMEKNKTPYLKISDTSGNLLWMICDTDNDAKAAQQFTAAAETLRDYGKLIIEAATEGQYKQHFKNCFRWVVSFAGSGKSLSGPVNGGGIPSGYISPGELESRLKLMKMEMEIERLKEQKKEKKDFPEIPPQYLAIAGELLGWAPEKVSRIAGASSEASGNATLEGTEEEQAEAAKRAGQIENLMIDIMSKADSEKIIKVLKAVNDNPDLLDKVTPFL